MMAKSASQRSDPAREFSGMIKSGPNLRNALGTISKGDKALREQREKREGERLMEQAALIAKGRKVPALGEEQKAQLQAAKDSKSKADQVENAKSAMETAFGFKKSGGLLKGGLGIGSKAKEGKLPRPGNAPETASEDGVKKISGTKRKVEGEDDLPSSDLADDEEEGGLGSGPKRKKDEKVKEGALQAAWPSQETATRGGAGGEEEEAVASEALISAHKGIGGSANLSLASPSQVVLTCRDLFNAMGKDTNLSKHPLSLRIPFL